MRKRFNKQAKFNDRKNATKKQVEKIERWSYEREFEKIGQYIAHENFYIPEMRNQEVNWNSAESVTEWAKSYYEAKKTIRELLGNSRAAVSIKL